MNRQLDYYPEREMKEQFLGSLWDWFTDSKVQVDRNSPAYIKWVQRSLNNIMGLRLAVDGVSGSKTRSAVRSFQKRNGLSVDGIVGSNTEKTLIKAGAIPPPISPDVPPAPTPSGTARPLAPVNTRLPKRGIGFTTSNNNYKYGLPETIEALKAIAKMWHSRHPDIQFMVRDISRQGGGKFSTHSSHRIGLDADVQLWIQGQKVCMSNRNYPAWRPYVQELVSVIRNNSILAVKTIGFTDAKVKNVSHWSGHTCHQHIRFCMPAKYKSQLNLDLVYRSGEKKANYHCSSQYEFNEVASWIDNSANELEEEQFWGSTWGWLTDPKEQVDRNSRAYIQWVQQSLNKIMELRLAVDGIRGSKTRSAIRDFQRHNGLAVDGIVGSNTERVLIAAGANQPPRTNVHTPPSRTGTDIHTPSPASDSFGILNVTVPNRRSFSYTFTPEDVLWTARFIVGEAGGKDTVDNRAVIWAMFNRYALFIRQSRKYSRKCPTFHQFIRAYSTTLQPCLRSLGAAKRNRTKTDWVECPDGSFYKDTNIRRGQRQKYLNLQRRPWSRLPVPARTLAEKALKGQVPNPIGLASEFASTRVYFKQRHKRNPNITEWRRFTKRHANRKGWTWIGTTPLLSEERQMKKNAFFVDNRVKNLPSNAVQVISPGS